VAVFTVVGLAILDIEDIKPELVIESPRAALVTRGRKGKLR
jgi:hypothetical protein